MPVTLLASQCPVPVVPAALVNPASGVPLTSRSYVTGDSTQLLTKLNENAAREDLAGRWGGGGYAVVQGLDISAGAGLLLNVAAGQAMIDGPVTVPTATTLALTNNIARAYVYLSQAGALVAVNNSLTPPAGPYTFLGSAVTSGGAITSVDQSGILYLRGGTLFRQTADVTTPTDTPPAALQYIVHGATESYLWDGVSYATIWSPLAMNLSAPASGQSLVIPAGYNLVAVELDTSAGATVTVNGTLRVLGNQ